MATLLTPQQTICTDDTAELLDLVLVGPGRQPQELRRIIALAKAQLAARGDGDNDPLLLELEDLFEMLVATQAPRLPVQHAQRLETVLAMTLGSLLWDRWGSITPIGPDDDIEAPMARMLDRIATLWPDHDLSYGLATLGGASTWNKDRKSVPVWADYLIAGTTMIDVVGPMGHYLGELTRYQAYRVLTNTPVLSQRPDLRIGLWAAPARHIDNQRDQES